MRSSMFSHGVYKPEIQSFGKLLGKLKQAGFSYDLSRSRSGQNRSKSFKNRGFLGKNMFTFR